MALEKELSVYNSKLPELVMDEGKYILIHEESVIGIYGTYEDAIKEGYEKFKLAPFLVKQIQAAEQIHFISRLLDPCHTLSY